jgi:hypothetical protein
MKVADDFSVGQPMLILISVASAKPRQKNSRLVNHVSFECFEIERVLQLSYLSKVMRVLDGMKRPIKDVGR